MIVCRCRKCGSSERSKTTHWWNRQRSSGKRTSCTGNGTIVIGKSSLAYQRHRVNEHAIRRRPFEMSWCQLTCDFWTISAAVHGHFIPSMNVNQAAFVITVSSGLRRTQRVVCRQLLVWSIFPSFASSTWPITIYILVRPNSHFHVRVCWDYFSQYSVGVAQVTMLEETSVLSATGRIF